MEGEGTSSGFHETRSISCSTILLVSPFIYVMIELVRRHLKQPFVYY